MNKIAKVRRDSDISGGATSLATKLFPKSSDEPEIAPEAPPNSWELVSPRHCEDLVQHFQGIYHRPIQAQASQSFSVDGERGPPKAFREKRIIVQLVGNKFQLVGLLPAGIWLKLRNASDEWEFQDPKVI